MKIPNNIEILTIEKDGTLNHIGGLIYQFFIYENDFSYYTSSFFKSDNKGILKISQQEIIEKSELKWCTELHNFKSLKTEICILNSDTVRQIRNSTENYLALIADDSKLENFITNSSFDASTIQKIKATFIENTKSQLNLKEIFRNANNDKVEIIDYELLDNWKNDQDKVYKFIVLEKK